MGGGEVSFDCFAVPRISYPIDPFAGQISAAGVTGRVPSSI